MTGIFQISDPHIVPYGQLAYGKVDTAAALARCVETINQCLPDVGPVDMAIVTGDLTDFGTQEEYHRFRTLMEPLEIPYRAVPGNHDDVPNMRECFADQSWMPTDGPINWLSEFADLTMIGLDSSAEGQAHGHLTETTLAFLKSTLDTHQGQRVIVALHHPPILTGIEKMDIQNLRESRELESILSGYDGELRLTCGHVHRNIVAPFGNVICQTAPGISHAVNLDLREGAPNCLTIEPGGLLFHETRGGIMTHSIPVGQFPGPFPFYPDR